MKELENRIKRACADANEMEKMLSDYLPFLKKKIADLHRLPLEYDDMMSLAMLTFVNCIRQYRKEKGNFFSFCSLCIQNRFIDESRKQGKYHSNVVSLLQEVNEWTQSTAEVMASVDFYSKEQERLLLCDEINSFSMVLKKFDIEFSDLARICPKQERSRKQCLDFAQAVLENGKWKDTLLKHHRLVQTELAEKFSVSPKTIEKHRKYIIALSILLLGDFPGMKAFLPQNREVKN